MLTHIDGAAFWYVLGVGMLLERGRSWAWPRLLRAAGIEPLPALRRVQRVDLPRSAVRVIKDAS